MAKIKTSLLFKHTREYFKIYLPNVKKYSPHTVRSYQNSLNMLLDFVKVKNNIPLYKVTFEMINGQTVMEFLDYIENERCCALSTRNHRLHCIRAFYTYAANIDPTVVVHMLDVCKIEDCKVPEKCISYMSKTAVDAVIKQPNTNTEIGLRDMFLMFFLYQTGARVQEILNIHLRDITFGKHAEVMLFGKGQKARSVPLRDACVLHLKQYIKAFHPTVPLNSTDYLFFVKRDGKRKRMSEDNVRRFISNYGKAAKTTCSEVPDNVHPHLFRHTRAMHLYQNGVDLMLISQWLGHSKMETTLIYAYADTEHKRKAIEKAIPVESPMNEFVNSNRFTIDDDELVRQLYGLR